MSTVPPGRAPHPVAEFVGLIATVVALGLAGFWWTRAGSGGVRPDGFAGDAACRSCHAAEAAAHGRSGHAKTLRPANRLDLARRLDGASVADPERPEATWRYRLEPGPNGAFTASRSAEARLVLDYAFGSGKHAVTFVSPDARDPDRPTSREHRLTWFAHEPAPGLGLTPGQSLKGHAPGNTPEGRTYESNQTLACFRCHATTTSDQGPEALDLATMIPNVGCERCHGPAKGHVEAARRGDAGSGLALRFAAGRWTAAGQLNACGECHRTPEMVKRAEIREDNPVLVRHQPVGLMQSACYLKSDGALSCVTCHAPHAPASTDRASYEAACLRCHQAAPRTPCPVSPRAGCVDCHMPRRDVGRGMLMTDHWVRVPTPSGRKSAAGPKSGGP